MQIKIVCQSEWMRRQDLNLRSLAYEASGDGQTPPPRERNWSCGRGSNPPERRERPLTSPEVDRNQIG